MRDPLLVLALSCICIALLTLTIGMLLTTINDWRDAKIRRQRDVLELERIKRESLILQGRKSEL